MKNNIYLIFSETDFLIGGIISNVITQRYFWPSSIYHSDDVTWCVPRIEPLPLWLKIRYVATKTAWIFCYSVVSIISIVILCLMTFNRDRFGYMNYEFVFAPRGITHPDEPVSTNRQTAWQNRTPPSNNSILKILCGIVLTVCVLLTIAWNFFLIKTITRTLPDFQARSVDDMIERNFRLSGDIFSNVTVWQHTKVRISLSNDFCEFHVNILRISI